MKVCSRCKENLPISKFQDGGKRKDCRDCRNARSRALAATQKDKKSAYQKIYSLNNKSMIAAYYQANKERIAEHNALPEVRLLKAIRDKGRKRKSTECYTRQNHMRRAYPCPSWHYKLVKLMSDTCIGCGTYEDLQVDHIVPISLGGINSFWNFQRLCGKCNRAKSVKLIEYGTKAGIEYLAIKDGVTL